MQVKFKKLCPEAVTPGYARMGDACMDLVATFMKELPGQVIYGTGIAVEIPQGYVGLLFPRSSIRKTGLLLINSVGVIDSGYRGELTFTFATRHADPSLYEVGDRIGQLLIIPIPTVELQEVDTLSASERGTNGHGSTGR